MKKQQTSNSTGKKVEITDDQAQQTYIDILGYILRLIQDLLGGIDKNNVLQQVMDISKSHLRALQTRAQDSNPRYAKAIAALVGATEFDITRTDGQDRNFQKCIDGYKKAPVTLESIIESIKKEIKNVRGVELEKKLQSLLIMIEKGEFQELNEVINEIAEKDPMDILIAFPHLSDNLMVFTKNILLGSEDELHKFHYALMHKVSDSGRVLRTLMGGKFFDNRVCNSPSSLIEGNIDDTPVRENIIEARDSSRAVSYLNDMSEILFDCLDKTYSKKIFDLYESSKAGSGAPQVNVLDFLLSGECMKENYG